MTSQPAKTRKRGISRQQILETAIALADSEGLAACNMRRIAQGLDVEAMSLYNHVANKDALLDGMAELVLATIPLPPEPAERWQDELRALAVAYRQMLYAHPALLPLLATRPINMTAIPAILARVLEALARVGLSDMQQRHAANALAGMVLGLALQYIGAPHVAIPPEQPPPTPTAPTARYIHTMPPQAQADDDFAFGLDTFITGLERMQVRAMAD
ncbi:MAG: TetR/AcrR family transcriptional regulator C-terminal domain-containing protein [Ktedonobacterales bacterium]|nr:TetR/AcrR family transcriptional regulator C-terminal domain-containing protein [Ktedonobacterales bacterium]